ncbi:MAG: ABC transporter substrate-binding protein [Mycobacteriales bacterium]
MSAPDRTPTSVPDPAASGQGASRRTFLTGSAVAGLGVAGTMLAGCGTGSNSGKGGGKGGSAGRQGKSGDTLFIAGFQWGNPSNFNPLGTSAAWPCGNGNWQLVYETLMRFNLLDGSLQPGLAKSMEQKGDKITVTLQKGTKWNDGKDLTADDVVYTFELAKKHPEVSYATFWDYCSKVEKTDASTIDFTIDSKTNNPGMVKGSIAGTYILPQHIWTAKEAKNKSIGNDLNLNPVGSGPFKIDKFDQTQVALAQVDNYWGKGIWGTPAPKYAVHPIYKDNSAGDVAFQSNEVDISQQFTPQVWKMWEVQKKPISTWYKKAPYHVPGGMPMLVMNTTKKGLDNPKVRRALAYCIDYARIAATAMSSYSVPANPSLILPTGGEAKYFDKGAVDKTGWKHDPAESKRILEKELGAKKGGDGIYVLPDGTKLGGWTAQCPTGWTDWQSALRIVADNAKAVGIGISTKFPQAPQVTQSVQNGDFDLACWGVAGVGPAAPWQRFRDVLDDRGVPAPGKNAFYNYGRFKDSSVQSLLDKAGSSTDDNSLKSALGQLDEIFRQNAPMVPLMYRPLEFFEFNEATWTNFPSAANPYAPPMFQGDGITWIFKIKRTTK